MKRPYQKSQCIVHLKSNWALLRFRYCFVCGFEYHREPGWRITLSFYRGVYDSELYLCRSCAPSAEVAMELFNRRDQLLPIVQPLVKTEIDEDELDPAEQRRLLRELYED